MKSMKQFLAALLVGGAGFGLFVACGGGESDCTLDADCDEGFACEAQACVATCESDADCAADEACEQGENTELDICVVDDTNNTTTTNNNTTSTNNNTVTNNTTAGTDLWVAQIVSAATGDDVCAPGDPGPDIFGVALETTGGANLGWGNVVWEDVQLEDNDHISSAHINGDPIDLAGETCPDFNEDNVVALGCGAENYIAVEFLDSEDQPIPLNATAGQQIHVFEWGTQCSDTGTSDEYDVFLCEDTAGIKEGDTSSCIVNLVLGAEGEAFADVTGF